jgi:CRISPR/Cas system-associated endonuclease Cas1
MNYDELREEKINGIEAKLRNGQYVSPFKMMPYRFELKSRLSDDQNALDELNKLIDFANESI